MPVRRVRGDEPSERDAVELAALADGSLASERRSALEERLAVSPELRERLAEQQQALALTRHAVEGVEAPASLRERIDAQRPASRAPRSRRLTLVAAGAAAVAAVAIGLSIVQSGSSGQRLHAALAPTGLVSGATGDATLTKTNAGWRIELNAAGLPRLDGGRFYEAWLRNASGVLVPIGTFNQGPKVTLWAGVSPLDFTTLTVTRERSDGNQASSGEKVLVGTVKKGG